MLFSSPLALLPRTLIAWALLTSALRAGEALQLLPGVPVVVSEAEPLAVRRAAADLCRDLQEVLQKASPPVSKAPADGPAIVIGRSDEGSGLTGPEAHAVLSAGDQLRLVEVLNGGVEVRCINEADLNTCSLGDGMVANGRKLVRYGCDSEGGAKKRRTSCEVRLWLGRMNCELAYLASGVLAPSLKQ